ncbi:Uma2 family endonuclease [Gloeobacter morelensis]|uniref:Uma2 family endonuclease n=1 Tax=Gloeobacter morelensis MG652769 TaxID=2781736 RepID=A0ABY3PQF7_9CYAN|nr:Uma2 family endonuclease [Gloeobacter morelensis]UFP95948.1 Uma2 family endonuclease [Gloeobacter morelensis MG652769]
MNRISDQRLTLEAFFELPDEGVSLELVNGRAIPKMSPKLFHAALQATLLMLLRAWGRSRGRALPEWAVVLRRHDEDWVPVPDLLYVSYERLPRQWRRNEACPVAPELVVEIISPGQTFGLLTGKAGDYLTAGVLRVWVIDSEALTITVFYPDRPPATFRENDEMMDELFAGFRLTPEQLFTEADLIEQ